MRNENKFALAQLGISYFHPAQPVGKERNLHGMRDRPRFLVHAEWTGVSDESRGVPEFCVGGRKPITGRERTPPASHDLHRHVSIRAVNECALSIGPEGITFCRAALGNLNIGTKIPRAQ